MFKIGSAVFLFIPQTGNQRILHPGKVIELDATSFVCEFEEAIAPVVGSDVNVYAESRGKFMQQGAAVLEVRQTEPKPIIAFAPVGQPVSAESRQTFRVSVIASDLVAQIDGVKNCKLVDVSATGFGVIVSKQYMIGTIIQIVLNHEGHEAASKARVQTVKALSGGKFRCGFLPTEKNGAASKMLPQISAAVQRAQLRRLAGAA